MLLVGLGSLKGVVARACNWACDVWVVVPDCLAAYDERIGRLPATEVTSTQWGYAPVSYTHLTLPTTPYV